MPIGLLEAAVPGGRECDRLARRMLGPGRGSCVFPPPCRPALGAATYAEAVRRNRASASHGLGISRQAYGLFPKLREVDGVLTPVLQGRLVEVHPEVSFTALRDMTAPDEAWLSPLRPKRTPEGRRQRVELLRRAGFEGVEDLVPRGR